MRAFISAGHFDQLSTVGEEGAVAGGVREHDLAVAIVNEMALRMLRMRPLIVPAVPLAAKIRWVNRWAEGGDVAIEVHINAAENESAHGVETYYCDGSVRGIQLAEALQRYLVMTGRHDRGVKPDSESARHRLGWLRDTQPWAALVEAGFLTNPDERLWLTGRGAQQVGRTLAEALDSLA
ncbi:MAG: N-acetylmuramoyl-L-alanine amidase [Dehalococcoidia bacterium]